MAVKIHHDHHHHHHCVLLILISNIMLVAGSLPIGINYGRIADNLPSPENAVPLLKSIGATKIRLYDADPLVLKSFANTKIEITIGLGNEYLSRMQDPNNVLTWLKTNVQCYYPATKITSISVGNEVLTLNDTSLSSLLLPAMENIYSSLCTLHLEHQIDVTSSHSLAILESSYPPSSSTFRQDLLVYISRILDFHIKTGSPFLINAYPFLAYKATPEHISLDFVLFQPNDAIFIDPVTQLRYDNMLFAQIDAIHSALQKVGCEKVCVQISETGWPSKGDADEPGATPENAVKYNKNLIKLMRQKKGTPMNPNANLNIYLFALFNENLKPGPTSERNFGLFKPDGTPAYPLGLGGTSTPTTTTPTSPTPSSKGNGTSSSDGDDPPVSVWSPPSNGYMAINSSPERLNVHWHSTMVVVIILFWVVGGGSVSPHSGGD